MRERPLECCGRFRFRDSAKHSPVSLDPLPIPPSRYLLHMTHGNQSAIFPETMSKAGWSKEETIDHLFKKAGYWKPRGRSAPVHGFPQSSFQKTRPPAAGGSASPPTEFDAAVQRSAVFLRFQTVSFRMGFRKYQRVRGKTRKDGGGCL